MPFWLGIVFGLMLGLVSGVTAIAVTMSSGHGEWMTPAVIGPSIGAFLAAMVGVGGAIWSHKSDVLERQRERKEASQQATIKLLASTIEFYGYTHLQLREFRRIARDRLVQPMLLQSLQEALKQTAIDLRHVAKNDDLPPGIAAMVSNFTRSFIGPNFPGEFTDEYLEASPPVQVTEEEQAAAVQVLQIYEALDKIIAENLRTLHTFAGLSHSLEDIDGAIDDVIKQAAESFGMTLEATL